MEEYEIEPLERSCRKQKNILGVNQGGARNPQPKKTVTEFRESSELHRKKHHGVWCRVWTLQHGDARTLTLAQVSVCSMYWGHQWAEEESMCVHVPVCDAVA